MLEKIVRIQPKETNTNVSGSETRDTAVRNLANDMLMKLPGNFIQHEVQLSLTSQSYYSCL